LTKPLGTNIGCRIVDYFNEGLNINENLAYEIENNSIKQMTTLNMNGA